MEIIWAAAVTGAFSVLVLLIEKGRKENVRDHGFVKERLDSIKEDIADIDLDISVLEHKIDSHISDHAQIAMIDFRPTRKQKEAVNGRKKR
jgi:hypothetical protein